MSTSAAPWRQRVGSTPARIVEFRRPPWVPGLRDSILVQTDDATLLAHKSQAQKVKELVKKLAEDPRLRKLV